MVVWCVVLCLTHLVLGGRELPDEWQEDIDAHADDIAAIIEYVQNSDSEAYHQAYRRLAKLTDIYGPRISGSEELEIALNYLYDEMEGEFGEGNVWKEHVDVPQWTRGSEYAEVVVPFSNRVHRMEIMAAGTSVGTSSENITAPIVIVHDINELDDCDETLHSGKIVVYNQDWPENGYDGVFMYRSEGGYRAEQCGAVAALIRSLTPISVYSPHTGTQSQTLNSTIPAACITVEDAEFLDRLTEYTEDDVEVTIYMEATNHPRSNSSNLMAKINGADTPNEYVMFGGHSDSWDVGTGAMDDAGGVIVSWQALSIVKQMVDEELLPAPKRTLMSVFWTAEEIDSAGANDFFEQHGNKDVSIILESDAGTFKPTGLGFSGSGLARAIMEEILEHLEPIDAHRVTDNMGGSVDLAPWLADNRTAGVLNNEKQDHDYWIYHHTHGDTMTVEDPDELDLCSILWATTVYVVADLHDMLPTEGEYPWVPDPTVAPTEPDVDAAPSAWSFSPTVLLLGVFMQMFL